MERVMQIRKAQMADMTPLCRLYAQLFKEMSELQPRYWRAGEQSQSFLLDMMQDEDGLLLVAEKEGELKGFLLAEQQSTPPFAPIRPHKFLYLMDIFVCPQNRGQGTGVALVESAKKWAKDRGLSYIELNVLHENTQATHAYERWGFSPAAQTMRKLL